MEIKVKSGREADARTVTFEYDIPTSVEHLVNKFGEEQVTELAQRSIVLAVQALARQKLAAGASDEDIQHAVRGWVPGVRVTPVKKSPFERAQSALAGMSPEELEALAAKIKEAKKHQK